MSKKQRRPVMREHSRSIFTGVEALEDDTVSVVETSYGQLVIGKNKGAIILVELPLGAKLPRVMEGVQILLEMWGLLKANKNITIFYEDSDFLLNFLLSKYVEHFGKLFTDAPISGMFAQED